MMPLNAANAKPQKLKCSWCQKNPKISYNKVIRYKYSNLKLKLASFNLNVFWHDANGHIDELNYKNSVSCFSFHNEYS